MPALPRTELPSELQWGPGGGWAFNGGERSYLGTLSQQRKERVADNLSRF